MVMSITRFVGLVYFVVFVVQDGVALEHDLLDLLQPALGRGQAPGGLSYFVPADEGRDHGFEIAICDLK
jgi:hypothetical protein